MDKRFYNAADIMELCGVSQSKAYSIIRALNKELQEKNYFIVSGKVPIAYFNDRFFGVAVNE